VKIVTSNPSKLAEFASFGLPLEAAGGVDLPEVDADALTVAVYKAASAGAGLIVEDTSLDVDGLDVGVNVRWLVSSLLADASLHGRAATWRVLLAANDGETVRVYEGVTLGTLTAPRGEGFGFDPIFAVGGQTLAEMGAAKAAVSARRAACEAYLAGTPIHTVRLADLPAWAGGWQH